VQGFSSVLTPSDSRDGTFFFNDFGVGYEVHLAAGWLRGIVPVAELHVNTPLTNRGAPGFADSTNATAGGYFLLGGLTRLGVAFGKRVAGPRLFGYEAVASVNWVF
jgi:hypothetical protein